MHKKDTRGFLVGLVRFGYLDYFADDKKGLLIGLKKLRESKNT